MAVPNRRVGRVCFLSSGRLPLQIQPQWITISHSLSHRLVLGYRRDSFVRETMIYSSVAPDERMSNSVIFRMTLQPKTTWRTELHVTPVTGQTVHLPKFATTASNHPLTKRGGRSRNEKVPSECSACRLRELRHPERSKPFNMELRSRLLDRCPGVMLSSGAYKKENKHRGWKQIAFNHPVPRLETDSLLISWS